MNTKNARPILGGGCIFDILFNIMCMIINNKKNAVNLLVQHLRLGIRGL